MEVALDEMEHLGLSLGFLEETFRKEEPPECKGAREGPQRGDVGVPRELTSLIVHFPQELALNFHVMGDPGSWCPL